MRPSSSNKPLRHFLIPSRSARTRWDPSVKWSTGVEHARNREVYVRPAASRATEVCQLVFPPHRSFIIPEVTSLTTARYCTDHEQVELFAKRDFQCDCPTSCLSHQCTLHKILAAPNDANTYGQNYIGNFCRCGRPYDAATEEETMVQCVACEASYSTPAELVWPSSHLHSPERPGLVPRVMPSPACTGHQWFAHRNPRCTGRRYW